MQTGGMTEQHTKRILPSMVKKNKLTEILKHDTFLMQFVPAAVIFLALLAFALGNWQNASRSNQAQFDKAVEQRVSLATDRLEERLNTSGTLLKAGNGLLYGSEFVSTDEWKRFYSQLTGDEQFIGACMVGYVPIITSEQRAEFEALLQAEGYASGISTSRTDGVMAPILYATKFDHEAVEISYGQDMYSDALFKQAMETARDSGRVSMTKQFSPASNKEITSVALFMPIYADGKPINTLAERQAAHTGYVFETINIKKLFASIIDEDERAFGFTVQQTDTTASPTQLYASPLMKNFSKVAEPTEQALFNEYGQTWKLLFFASDDIVSSSERPNPATALGAGLGLAIIASILAYMLLKYRTRIFAMAEEQKLQQAKDELLSLASHQLRTPATGVKQYVGMVLDGFGGPVPKDQAKLLEQAYKSNERQLQIINEFLYVAKLGSGSLTTTKHKFDIAPLVRDVIEEMSLDVKEKHHTVKVKIPKSVPLKADEHSVRMIIENLLSNAIKYTQPGGKIEIELRQGNREVLVSIRDNGVGIAKKDQKLLFKQFSRIPNELTNEVSGSGIGLYLAQQLAVRNGGKITLESETARGSTFTLSLPNWRVKKITMPRRNA